LYHFKYSNTNHLNYCVWLYMFLMRACIFCTILLMFDFDFIDNSRECLKFLSDYLHLAYMWSERHHKGNSLHMIQMLKRSDRSVINKANKLCLFYIKPMLRRLQYDCPLSVIFTLAFKSAHAGRIQTTGIMQSQ
jgi:hypothetical protein